MFGELMNFDKGIRQISYLQQNVADYTIYMPLKMHHGHNHDAPVNILFAIASGGGNRGNRLTKFTLVAVNNTNPRFKQYRNLGTIL